MHSRNVVVRTVARIIRFFRNVILSLKQKAQGLFDAILNYLVVWLCRYYQQDMAFNEY